MCSVLMKAAILFAVVGPWVASGQQEAMRDLLSHMATNEINAKAQPALFAYTSEERSARTGGHLWGERVVETRDGIVRRLTAVDGKELTDAERAAEQERLQAVIADPTAFRKLNAGRKDDESHALQLLQLLPRAFVLSAAGDRDGCVRLAFVPDPAYSPATYEERVIHAMTGTIEVQQSKARLCALDATIATPVEFGYGVFGRLNQGGQLGLERKEVEGENWKTSRIELHLNGKVLLMKSLTKEQTTTRTSVRVLREQPSLAQAVQMTER